MKFLQSLIHRDKGASMVEVAILSPFLILLVLGVIEMGRMMFLQVELNEAAQEGALYATFQPNNNVDIRTRVVENTDSLSLDIGDVAVTCPTGGRVRVTVTKQVPLIGAFFLEPVLGDPITMRGEVEGEVHSDSSCDPSP